MRRFSFLPSFYEACQNLPDDQRLEAYDAIIFYGVNGEYPNHLSSIGKLILDLLAPVIDSKARWLQAQTENGSKGGRPKRDATIQNPEETQQKPIKNPEETHLPRSKEYGERSKEIGNRDIRESADKPPARKRFQPPTLDEVREYCNERGNRVDPQRWFDFYVSNGWRVGKNPMKDWRAAVRTWERNGIAQNLTPAMPERVAGVEHI